MAIRTQTHFFQRGSLRTAALSLILASATLSYAQDDLPSGEPRAIGTFVDAEISTAESSQALGSLDTIFAADGITGSIAHLDTDQGDIYFALTDSETPKTVANFQDYIDDKAYDDSIFHRLVPGFVVQGGGFTSEIPPASIETNDPVENEPGIPNTRGTVSVAKLGGDPDSGTNQFFISLADNREILDDQNGGFTVFARVLQPSMSVVDQIAGLSTANFGGAFSELPVESEIPEPAEGEQVEDDQIDLLTIKSIRSLRTVGEGGYLTVTTSSSNDSNVVAKVVNGDIIVERKSEGSWTETISLTARDPFGRSATAEFFINSGDGSDTPPESITVDQDGNEVSGPVVIPGATSTGQGWEFSDWFGFYHAGSAPWIYHEHHGWLYTVSNGDGSLWVWHPFFQWVYIAPGSYPWMYRADRDWMLFDLTDPSANIFWDGLEEFWFQYFPEG